ncbi:GDT1-like protein 5 [Linum perenne]
MSSVAQGFSKSLAMTILSEIGDKTFIAAAILAMRHPRRLVLSGCLSALIVMTHDHPFSCCWLGCSKSALSYMDTSYNYSIVFWIWALVLMGWIQRSWVRLSSYGVYLSSSCPYCFASLVSFSLSFAIRNTSFMAIKSEELAEVEAKLDADWKSGAGTTKADDESKKKTRPFLAQFFSPILLKAFSITFFGEWGDKSQVLLLLLSSIGSVVVYCCQVCLQVDSAVHTFQLATIGLAADENPFGVVLGGIVGQALCTTAAVIGGKSLASQISERMVALSGGILFIVFGVQSFLSEVN